MATEFSNGKQVIKLYRSVNRGRPMYQLSYYVGGKRMQKNFADKAEAERMAGTILNTLGKDAMVVDSLTTAELESFVVARRVSFSSPLSFWASSNFKPPYLRFQRWNVTSWTLCSRQTSRTV
ncbi:MAG: hypothetical protein WDO13_14430 [Verrucomicrobiota bacterium]